MINWLCLVLFSTSSHDERLAATMYDRDHCRITLTSGVFQWADRYTKADSEVFGLSHKLWSVHSKRVQNISELIDLISWSHNINKQVLFAVLYRQSYCTRLWPRPLVGSGSSCPSNYQTTV